MPQQQIDCQIDNQEKQENRKRDQECRQDQEKEHAGNQTQHHAAVQRQARQVGVDRILVHPGQQLGPDEQEDDQQNDLPGTDVLPDFDSRQKLHRVHRVILS